MALRMFIYSKRIVAIMNLIWFSRRSLVCVFAAPLWICWLFGLVYLYMLPFGHMLRSYCAVYAIHIITFICRRPDLCARVREC